MACPIFIGGTGRSGTTMVARLLGSHPDYFMIPIEVRFLVDPGGLCDLVAGQTDFDEFERRMTSRWWYRRNRVGDTRGLFKIMDEPPFRAALAKLATDIDGDVLAASRSFVEELLDAVPSPRGAIQWIEMTPPNVLRGRELARLIPDMKLVHSLRDGRDVAASVAQRSWGPSDVFSALRWWADRLIQAQKACADLSDDQLHVVPMEDLVENDPEYTLADLFDFVGVKVTDEVTDHFARRVDGSRANIGRWSSEVPRRDHGKLNQEYKNLLDELTSAGAPLPVTPASI